MLKKRKCVFGMYHLKDTDFIARVREIQTMLSAAPVFSGIVPAPATIVPMLDQLAIWDAESRQRDYRNVAPRRALRAQLDTLVSGQCTSVNAIAQGDVNKLVLSGFELNKIPAATTAPEYTEIDFVENKGAGTAMVYIKHRRNVGFYELLFKGPNNFQRIVSSSHPHVEVPNLPEGVRLSVVARAVNRKGVGEWSLPVKFVVSIDPNAEDV